MLEARRVEPCNAEVVGFLPVGDTVFPSLLAGTERSGALDGVWEEATRVVPAGRCQHLKLVLI